MAKNLIFTCPKCQSHQLECCERGPYTSIVTDIAVDGVFGYGPITAHGEVDRFQCFGCGYVLGTDYTSTNNVDVIDWIRKNCPQPK